MAWTQDDLDKLQQAIATGERRVKFADKEVEYRTINELKSAYMLVKKEVEKQDRPFMRVYAATGKGL